MRFTVAVGGAEALDGDPGILASEHRLCQKTLDLWKIERHRNGGDDISMPEQVVDVPPEALL